MACGRSVTPGPGTPIAAPAGPRRRSESGSAGHLPGMIRAVSSRWRRFFSPLTVVLAAVAVFVLLLVAVRTQWLPLEDADHGAADGLNNLVAGEPAALAIIKAVTFLGSSGVLWTVVGLAAAGLALRR